MTHSLSKTTNGTVTSCYQVMLAKYIVVITDTYINSHFFMRHHWVNECLILNVGHVVERFNDWSDNFDSESAWS